MIPAYTVKPAFSSAVANVDSTNADMKRWYNGFDMSFNARMPRGIRAFGGVNIERSLNDICVAAVSDPNRSLYCDQSESGIPWQKQFKGTVVYPLPWQGISVSAALQSLNGYVDRHRGPGLRRVHRRHRLRSPARPRHVLAGHADDALCGRLSQPRARPSALVLPTLAASGAATFERAAGGAGNRIHAAHHPA